jgi:hypothetical protein
MKKPNKAKQKKDLKRSKKKNSKDIEKKRRNKIKSQKRLADNIKEKKNNKETFILQEEVRKIQNKGLTIRKECV